MKISQIEAAGGYASEVVEKRIKWKNPKTKEEHDFTVGVKRRSYGTLERVLVNDDKQARCAMQIAECIILDGEQFSYEQAYALEPSLGREFNKAITEVNDDAEKEAAAKN